MKRNVRHLLLFIVFATVLFSFRLLPASGIKGTASPAENAAIAIAVNGTDSLKTEITQGAFQFPDVKKVWL